MNEAQRDLLQYIDSINYGAINVEVKRVNRKTTVVTTIGEETLKYEDNKEALKDLLGMLTDLINMEHTGEATVKITMKDGNIKLLSIFHQKETKYS